MSLEPESTITISAEALRRLEVEAAHGRGELIACRRRTPRAFWGPCFHLPNWDWVHFEYRVELIVVAERAARRDLLDRIEALIAELKAQDA
jgi:hypothetical protein